MIIRNETMFNGRSYKTDSSDNTKKLKALMSTLIIKEGSKEPDKPEGPKSGGSVWKGSFGPKSKKPKTFKL